MKRGFVSLVGAGPGDPELLTLAGRRRLEAADCVIYDTLIDPRLLEHAPPAAERLYVGKQAGAAGCTSQAAIDALLVERAQAGQRVVRLKGGDPLLFARGAEEALALEAAGVAYEIIPGVTAALAAAATASVPLTHRPLASAVTLVTGHEDPTKPAAVDWGALARSSGTLVIYMGLRRLPEIARQLLEGGRHAATPIVLVEWGGSNRQKVAAMTLEEIAPGVPPGFHSPVLAIVGEVCGLRPQLGWFERRPLFGQRILVPRPPEQAGSLARRLEDLGAEVLCEPVFDILPPQDWEPVDQAIEQLHRFGWIVFTSRNGVRFFLERLLAQGRDLRALGAARLAAIGPGTASALQEYHLRADLVPAEFRAEALAAALGPEVGGTAVLLVRANRGREVLGLALEPLATTVTTIVAYRQVDRAQPRPEVLRDLALGKLDWVLFSSSNMALGFFRWLDPLLQATVRQQLKIVSISPVTSATIEAAGFRVTAEASPYTMDGLIGALVAAAPSKLEPGFQPLPDDQARGEQDEDIREHAEALERDGDGKIQEEEQSHKTHNDEGG